MEDVKIIEANTKSVSSAVPERVFKIHEPEKNEIDVSFDAVRSRNDEDVWWNQKALTTLDLSSNTLTNISSALANLTDLTILNVRLLQLNINKIYVSYVMQMYYSYTIML